MKHQIMSIDFYNARENVIQLFDDYTRVASEGRYKTNKGAGHKILTAIQMLQMLPMTISQVKVGNTSENLVNKIKRVIDSFSWANEVSKKVYNNIRNSIMQNGFINIDKFKI